MGKSRLTKKVEDFGIGFLQGPKVAICAAMEGFFAPGTYEINPDNPFTKLTDEQARDIPDSKYGFAGALTSVIITLGGMGAAVAYSINFLVTH